MGRIDRCEFSARLLKFGLVQRHTSSRKLLLSNVFTSQPFRDDTRCIAALLQENIAYDTMLVCRVLEIEELAVSS
ncbi:hypothetical protein EBE87_27530 [Pseudoroseomonas wenyumeiae]|uniref:Uncharacterized protein n=1 Tax=Teichococcus wenyumeiae TaxID=2478470 RepID=A0A3A9JL86_9PROT|nr:hypothetical protein D6Z83_25555 [Pseudoroseomonas wenyumeiae]RMI14666.1 hypothetical protein EBE87_27530 [Pseudoroseomonas wenyumeiae]